MMDAQDAIERLCKLQSEAHAYLGYESAGDCFCGKSGFWGGDRYDGTFRRGYRNDGLAIEFIEKATREKITGNLEQAKRITELEQPVQEPALDVNEEPANAVDVNNSENINDKLLPCPFCGSEDISEGKSLGYNKKLNSYNKQTGCGECGALGGEAVSFDLYDNSKANKEWNKRATLPLTPALRDELIECLELARDYPAIELVECQDLLQHERYRVKAKVLEEEIATIDKHVKALREL